MRLADLRVSLSPEESTTREYGVELVDEDDGTGAVVEKSLYVRQDRPGGSLGRLRERPG